MCVYLACAHNHVVAIVNFIEQALYIFRGVLTISIHEHQNMALCIAGTGLDRCAIAHGVNVRDDLDLVLRADINGVVC